MSICAALIGVSTLYTKQHYVIDVIAGAAAALVAYAIFLRTYSRSQIPDSDHVGAPLRALAIIPIWAMVVGGFWVAYRFLPPDFAN